MPSSVRRARTSVNIQSNPKEIVFDAYDTMIASWRYFQESASISEECKSAWLQAALAQSIVVTVGTALSYGSRATHGSYKIAQYLLARGLGSIYVFAFGISYRQNRALIGSKGLAPCYPLLERVHSFRRDWRSRIQALPSLCWFVFLRRRNNTTVEDRRHALDLSLDALAMSGLILAFPLAIGLISNVKLAGCVLIACYLLYLSISTVASAPFFGYGFESQLCETSFLASCWLLGGLLGPGVISMRWLCFKIMLGAGLIKKRASIYRKATDCWKDLSAMTTFYETQPMPGPLSRRLHFLPRKFHFFATASNHVIELVLPWFLLLCWIPAGIGRAALITYGLTHILFQATLCLSGNLSFLNWITMLPSLACFDDGFFLDSLGLYGIAAQASTSHSIIGTNPLLRLSSFVFSAFGLALLIWLNAPALQNLFTPSSTRIEKPPRQLMNAAFDRIVPRLNFNLRAFRLANAYGAFGSVSASRDEIVILGSRGAEDNYQFKQFGFHTTACRQIAPWHLRLDWQKWLLACTRRDINGERWFIALLLKLIDQCPETTRLLRHNPFSPELPPTHIRVDLYSYRFRPLEQIGAQQDGIPSSSTPATTTDFNDEEEKVLWTRSFRSTLVRPIGRADLEQTLRRHDFNT